MYRCAGVWDGMCVGDRVRQRERERERERENKRENVCVYAGGRKATQKMYSSPYNRMPVCRCIQTAEAASTRHHKA